MSNLTSYDIFFNDYGVSYYYLYVNPIVAAFSAIQNILCTIVLASKELRNSNAFFQYALVNSIGAALSSILLIFLFLTRCGGSNCSISTSYWSQAFSLYAVTFVSSSFYTASALIQISMCMQIYFVIKQTFRRFSAISPYKTCFVFFGNIR